MKLAATLLFLGRRDQVDVPLAWALRCDPWPVMLLQGGLTWLSVLSAALASWERTFLDTCPPSTQSLALVHVSTVKKHSKLIGVYKNMSGNNMEFCNRKNMPNVIHRLQTITKYSVNTVIGGYTRGVFTDTSRTSIKTHHNSLSRVNFATQLIRMRRLWAIISDWSMDFTSSDNSEFQALLRGKYLVLSAVNGFILGAWLDTWKVDILELWMSLSSVNCVGQPLRVKKFWRITCGKRTMFIRRWLNTK